MTQRIPFAAQQTWKLVLYGTLFACMAGTARSDLKPDLKTFEQQVQPLLKKYCVSCHGSETSEAEMRFDIIDPDIVTGEHFGKWEDVREAFNTGEMPPEDEPQPTSAERDVITRWLDAELKKAKQYGSTKERGSVRRLTRYELQYALEDLLYVSAKEEVAALPEEGTSLETGLKNNARLLMISGPHLESYLDVIISVVDKMKEIAAFEPHSASVDIENLDTAPSATLTPNGRKHKPPLAKIERAGKGVVVNPAGYVDLRIPSISRYMFQTLLTAKADVPGEFQVSIGFTYSDVDPRQKVAELGVIKIHTSDTPQPYTLNSYPESLPAEMTRALDRPFFIRITNRSKQKLYLESFDYQGNVNTELTSSLIPPNLAQPEIDNHVRKSILAFIEKAFRRSPTEAEFERYYGIYQGHADAGNSGCCTVKHLQGNPLLAQFLLPWLAR